MEFGDTRSSLKRNGENGRSMKSNTLATSFTSLVRAVGSVIWAVVLPQFKNTKVAYAVSLIIGGVGFAHG